MKKPRNVAKRSRPGPVASRFERERTDMRSLARPHAPMRRAESKTHSSEVQKTTVAGAETDARTDARAPARAPGFGTGDGGLGTTAEFVVGSRRQKPLKPAWAVGLVEFTDCETGEIIYARRAHDCSVHVVRSPAEKRVLRYERKAAAVAVLGKRHRIAACHTNPVKNAQTVDVWAKQGVALPGHFHGLQTCALSWLCSVCAPKIAERRAGEIASAMTVCKAQGGQVLMPTFTAPHQRKDSLAQTLDRIKKALRTMASWTPYRQLQERLGVTGRIIATEITHGEANGWHPHFHELWFFDRGGVDLVELEAQLYGMWRKACLKAGLGEPSRKHGVVVQHGSRAAQYVSKMGDKEWGLSDEIAKASSKGGRGGSRSAWQLLDCMIDPEATPAHQKRAEALFREYAEATKGTQQLRWTPGLKKRYAIVEMNDEELCAQAEEDSVLIAQIPLDAWRAIRLQKMQAHILNAVQYGADVVKAMVDQCLKVHQLQTRQGDRGINGAGSSPRLCRESPLME